MYYVPSFISLRHTQSDDRILLYITVYWYSYGCEFFGISIHKFVIPNQLVALRFLQLNRLTWTNSFSIWLRRNSGVLSAFAMEERGAERHVPPVRPLHHQRLDPEAGARDARRPNQHASGYAHRTSISNSASARVIAIVRWTRCVPGTFDLLGSVNNATRSTYAYGYTRKWIQSIL